MDGRASPRGEDVGGIALCPDCGFVAIIRCAHHELDTDDFVYRCDACHREFERKSNSIST